MTQKNWTITYEDKRCSVCGRFWSVENARGHSSLCPCCAWSKREERNSTVNQRDRTIVNLRGQITKLKKSLKK